MPTRILLLDAGLIFAVTMLPAFLAAVRRRHVFRSPQATAWRLFAAFLLEPLVMMGMFLAALAAGSSFLALFAVMIIGVIILYAIDGTVEAARTRLGY